MTRTSAILLASAVAAIVGCTTYAPLGAEPHQAAYGGERQCFYAPNVIGFRQGPENIVYVNTNSRDYYELRTLNYCAERLDFEHRIALRSRAGSFVCSGYDAEIYVPDALGSTYCPVHATRKLSPEEVTALRATKSR